jgi:catechol 2,3-dioxygenase-like lactoylglutathione lyase family enzyme
MDKQTFEVSSVFAVLPVKDIKESVEWYTTLFGRNPDNQPAPNVAEYYLSESKNPEHGTLQLMIDEERAGGGLATINVSNIEQISGKLAAEDIPFNTRTFPINEAGDIHVTVGTLIDIDGNSLNIVQPPRLP